MKYYIYRDEEIIPISQADYDKWVYEEMKEVLPPVLHIMKNENIYSMEFSFEGDVEEGEAFEPFEISYSKAILKVTSTKIEEVFSRSRRERFITEKEMQERRYEIIRDFKND